MNASPFFVAQRPQPSVVNHLPVAGPFNLEVTVRLLQRRPTNRVDHWEGGRYLRAFQTAEGPRLVALLNTGTVDVPDLRLEILEGAVSEDTARDVTETVRWMLGCDADPAPTAWLAEMEPRFGAVAAALRGFRPPCFPTLFETCASVLPFQQFSLDAGTAIVGRLVERFGPSLTIGDRAWFAFPTPEAVAEAPVAALRDVGLSQAKAVALQALARHALAADLNAAHYQSLPTGVALEELEALPGIGPWSAGLILLRGLRRMEIFPAGDVGAARNLPALLGLAASWSPADASTFADRFADRRGYLYFLGLGAQLLSRGFITPADQH
jgi:DNA-3-methyladenine glycosylase II